MFEFESLFSFEFFDLMIHELKTQALDLYFFLREMVLQAQKELRQSHDK